MAPAAESTMAPHITNFPDKVILQILESLSPSATVVFALTCKRTLKVSGKQSLEALRGRRIEEQDKQEHHYTASDVAERWELLKLLERDLPEYELCHFCAILHRLSTVDSPVASASGISCLPDESGACKRQSDGPEWWNMWKLGFRDVYLVMQRHRFGERFGRPLSSLSTSSAWTKVPDNAISFLSKFESKEMEYVAEYVKLDTEAAIVRDELVLHTVQRMWVPHNLKRPLSEPVVKPRIEETPYRWPHDDWECSCMEELLDRMNKRGAASALRSPSLKRRQCSFQYQTIIGERREFGVEIISDTWHRLGPCASPDEGGWKHCWPHHKHNYEVKPPDAAFESPEWMVKAKEYSKHDPCFSSVPGESAAMYLAALEARPWSESPAGKSQGEGPGMLKRRGEKLRQWWRHKWNRLGCI